MCALFVRGVPFLIWFNLVFLTNLQGILHLLSWPSLITPICSCLQYGIILITTVVLMI